MICCRTCCLCSEEFSMQVLLFSRRDIRMYVLLVPCFHTVCSSRHPDRLYSSSVHLCQCSCTVGSSPSLCPIPANPIGGFIPFCIFSPQSPPPHPPPPPFSLSGFTFCVAKAFVMLACALKVHTLFWIV